MQLLKRCVPLALIVLFSCTPGGPLSPKDAARQLQTAFANRDVRALKGVLSRGSLEKVKVMAKTLRNIKGTQAEKTEKYYRFESGSLEKMTADAFLVLYLRNESKRTLGKILKSDITGIKRDHEKAQVFFSAGAALDFVREGPYWKFDLTRL